MAESKIYLTTAPNPKGPGLLAVISRGQPQLGDLDVTVLDMEVCGTEDEARNWYQRMLIEKPWEQRN